MDPEIQKQFEEFDDRLRQAENRIFATGNLVSKVGIPRLVEAQMKIDALMDSDARLYGALQQLAEFQKKTDQRLQELAESQKTTDQRLDHLAATVQNFVDSLRKSGNGSKS
jgi:methyl-accepting chemotaxis protein